MNINDYLNNTQNVYYGHGTGYGEKEVIDSIFTYGLKCPNNMLYRTSEVLGSGNEISDERQAMLKNWTHNDSKFVIILSLPQKFFVYPSEYFGTFSNSELAYYYTPNISNIDRKKYPRITNSSFVMPEFVAGYYDSINDTFVPNPRYYENLSIDEQTTLFNRVKSNYFKAISDYVDIKDYIEGIKSDPRWQYALTEEETQKFQREKDEIDLISQISPELINRELNLPNGKKISAKEYIKEIVLPFIPARGDILLNTGAKLPVSHFIMECVIFDCQERYNGDFAKYMSENVNLEDSIKLHENIGRNK